MTRRVASELGGRKGLGQEACELFAAFLAALFAAAPELGAGAAGPAPPPAILSAELLLRSLLRSRP